MAIDFSNRNPDDKDGVYRIQPAQQRGWIEVNEDGSWKGRFQVARPANTTGWKEVGYATVTLNDGRQFRAVLDENNQPISEIGDPIGTDNDVARSFSQRSTQQQRGPQEGDTRGPQTGQTREVFRNGQWVVEPNPLYQQSQGTTDWRPEGTPDPNAPGGYDNERPIMVRSVNGQREQREMTPAERQAWTDARERSRNPGGKTDQQIADERKEAEAKAERNKPGAPILKPDGKGGTVAVQTMPDGSIKTTPLPGVPSDKPQPPRVTVNGTVYERGEDGVYKPAAGLPTEGVGNIPGLPTYVPDLTKPGAGLFEYAKQLDEFMKAHPSFTWEKRQQVLEAAQKQASTVVQEFNIGASVLREQYQTSVTQRGQDMTQANNRAALANTHHQNAIGLIEKFAPYLGVTPGDAGKLFLGMMASQLATATAYGGMQNYGREEMDPRLLSFADRAVGGASRPASPTPPGTPPNALGLGSISAVQAPGATPTAAAPNPDAAMAESVRQQRAASGAPLPAPLLGPQPAVTAAGGVQAPAMAAPPAAPGGSTMPTPEPVLPFYDHGGAYNPGRANATGWPAGADIPSPPPNATPVPIPDPYATPSPAQSMVPPALESMVANVLPPEPVSWHERAQAQASAFEQPGNVGRMESLIGGAVPSGPMFGGFNLGGPVGQAPLAMASRIPGLTPEADAEAKRQLAMGV